MNNIVDLEKIIADINKRKSDIDRKYKQIIEKINKLNNEIDEIPIKYSNRSKQYQKEQRLILSAKIEELERKINEWISEQKEKAEQKLSKFQETIIEESDKYLKNLTNSKNNFSS